MEYSIEQLLALIEETNEDERHAISGYYKLLDVIYKTPITSNRDNRIIDQAILQIKEIISDELNHSSALNELAINLSGIKPAID